MDSPEMSNSSELERLIRDLRHYREQHNAVWGDVTDILVARYLTGECNAAERLQVERQMQRSEEVRDAVRVLQEVLGAQHLVSAPAETPSQTKIARIWTSLQAGTFELAERINCWINEQREFMAQGGVGRQMAPQLVYAHLGDHSMIPQTHWKIPLEGTDREVLLKVGKPQSERIWNVSCAIECHSTEPTQSTFFWELRRGHELPLISGPANLLGETSLNLEPGLWHLTVRQDQHSWRIPVNLQ